MMTLGLLLISFANLSSKTKDELPAFENIKNCEDYIIKSENKYPNIIKNTEKTILFSNKDKEKTEFAIVYIHGFSASRQEISPVIERLSKRLNVNVFFTRLRGHGLSSIDMKDATAKNLIYDTSEAIEIGRQLGEKLIVVGNSVGGTYSFEPRNELHKKNWTEEYPSSAIVEMMKTIKKPKR